MPVYNYKALNDKGRKIKGKINSASSEQLKKMLKQQNLYLIDYDTDIQMPTPFKLDYDFLIDFTLHLRIMLKSGIALPNAIKSLQSSSHNKQYIQVYQTIYDRLLNDDTLSNAIGCTHNVFPPIVINMIRSGERTGTLLNALEALMNYFESLKDNNRKLMQAVARPLFLITFLFFVNLLVIGVIFPNMFNEALYNFKTDFVTQIYIFLVAMYIITKLLYKIPAMRAKLDELKVKIPLVRSFYSVHYTHLFMINFAMLYESGEIITSIIESCCASINNSYCQKKCSVLIENVNKGLPLSECFKPINFFDYSLIKAIAVGEKAGTMTDELNRIKNNHKEMQSIYFGRLTKLLNIACFIFFAISFISYIYNISSAISIINRSKLS